MKNVERICRDLIIQAKEEKLSKSVLILLIQEEWNNINVTKSESIEEKEKNKMTEREKNLEKKVIELNEEMETLMSQIRDKYGEKIERLKQVTADEILSSETEKDKRKAINKFYNVAKKIEAEQIKEEQNLKREIIKRLLSK